MRSSDGESDDYDDERALIIENGSNSMKVGFAGEETPHDVFPTLIGHPRCSQLMGIAGTKNQYIGDSAQTMRGILNLNHPIQCGSITDWDDMEKIWAHVLNNELRVIPEEHNVLMIDKTGNQDERKKMAEIMFEKFEISGLHVSLQSVLSLYGCGKTTGIVLDSSYELTDITPIYEGKRVLHAIKRLEFGGKNMTEYLIKLTSELGYSIFTTSDMSMWNEMKEKICHVSQCAADGSLTHEILKKDYELPWGERIALKEQQFKTPEALFYPELMGLEDAIGFHTALNSSILKCFNNPVPNHYELYNNIVLCGGNTMFDGFEQRLSHELRQIMPSSMVSKVLIPPNRKYCAWTG